MQFRRLKGQKLIKSTNYIENFYGVIWCKQKKKYIYAFGKHTFNTLDVNECNKSRYSIANKTN